MSDTTKAMISAIDARRGDLTRLTQDLIRIPTLNPPGRNYLEICEYLGARLEGQGFRVELVRAHGAPGDSAEYPRWNMVARREGVAPGDCVHFNSHHDVVEVGHGMVDLADAGANGMMVSGPLMGLISSYINGALAGVGVAADVMTDEGNITISMAGM